MTDNIPRIMVAAPSSGSGKTTITCGLIKAFLNRKYRLSSFKCGPDYIDPMFHKYVLGVSGGNLDSFFLEDDGVRRQFLEGASDSDLALLEGVMGFYDGVAGVSLQASSYDIARITDTPVILVVDCKGASLSLAALIQGFLQYKMDDRPLSGIKGVLLNRISGMMAQRLKPEIQKLGIPVVGWLPECRQMTLESRHLGLVMPKELEKLQDQMEELAAQMAKTVDLDKIYEIARSAPGILLAEKKTGLKDGERVQEKKRGLRIAVARDQAFCFYYQENLRLLEELGAELVFFSPLKDRRLPNEIDGLLLGGGYPELYAKELSANGDMLSAIKALVDDKIPYLAECGGFLYLHRHLEDRDQQIYPMVDVIKGQGFGTGRLSRFGYISLTPLQEEKCLQGEIKGHEFHYWDSTDCGTDWEAKKPVSGKGWICVHSREYQIGGFPHLYYPSNPEFIARWLDGCRCYGGRRKGD